jgi:hypothetical protein
MSRQGVLVALLVLVGVGLIGWLLLTEAPEAPPRQNVANGNEPSGATSSGTEVEPENVPDALPSAFPTAVEQTAGSVPKYTGPSRDRQRADELRELLAAMYAGQLSAQEAAGDASATSGARMPAPEGEGNQSDKPLGKYVGRMMREQFAPLAGECYDQLLERTPDAEGQVTLEFSIMGDPSVGGVVVDAGFGEATNLSEGEFTTCIRESMYSVVFDAPPKGHATVSVAQSLEFSP